MTPPPSPQRFSKHLAVHHGRPLAFLAPPTSSGGHSHWRLEVSARDARRRRTLPSTPASRRCRRGSRFSPWHTSLTTPLPACSEAAEAEVKGRNSIWRGDELCDSTEREERRMKGWTVQSSGVTAAGLIVHSLPAAVLCLSSSSHWNLNRNDVFYK